MRVQYATVLGQISRNVMKLLNDAVLLQAAPGAVV